MTLLSMGSDFELLIFDMDGVLVNTSPCHSKAFQDLWREIGIEGVPYEEIAGRKTTDVIDDITRELSPSAIQKQQWVQFKQQRARFYLIRDDIAYSDTTTCLSALTDAGLSMALGTSASRENAQMILDRLGLNSYFDTIVTGEDVVEGKPAPEIYLTTMSQTGANPQRTLVIEDSVAGLLAAANANTYSASVRTGAKIEDSRFIGTFSNLAALLPELGIANV